MSNSRRRQICLFGTSANPPTGTGGHLGIVNALLSVQDPNKFDEIWVMPVYVHMFSEKRGKHMAAFAHRVEMCRRLVEGNPSVKVSTIELQVFNHHVHLGRYESKKILKAFAAV